MLPDWNQKLGDQLATFAGIEVDAGDTHISVSSGDPGSFGVSMFEDDGSFVFIFDAWHEHFEDPETAVTCFELGPSTDCRLKVIRRGDMECSWRVPIRENDEWVDQFVTGLIFVPFWRKAHIEYRQNVLRSKDTG